VERPVAIVFFPESGGITPEIREWQARNPDGRRLLDEVITCPVCGIPVRAIADFALLDDAGIRAAVDEYRDQHLRAACSDHAWPTRERLALINGRSR